MKARFAAVVAVTLWAGVALSARAATLPASSLKGTPEIQPGKQAGIYLWTDEKGVHLRWSSDGKPLLFSGTVKVSKAFGPLTRFNSTAGGWVEVQGGDTLVFSSTVGAEADGFDLSAAAGSTVTVEIEMDGKPADVALVFVGEKLAHPTKVPIRFTYSK